jgi:very-short-patch-repair endonuclease
LAALGGRQHRLVAGWQLRRLGFDRNAIDYRVARGRLAVVYRGVYAVGDAPLTPQGWTIAAVLACGPAAVASHRSAAALWGLLASWPEEPEVTVTTPRRSRPGITVHPSRRLVRAQTTRRENIPLTTPARTIIDLADTEPERQVERAIAEGEAQRLLYRSHLAQELQRTPGRRGTKVVAEMLAAEHLNRTKSDLEEAFLAFLHARGLPRPETNKYVEGFEVDAVWRDQRLVVELDSYQFHGTRTAFETDRLRDAKLQTIGYRIIRITWRRLADPDALEHDLRALLNPVGPATRTARRSSRPWPHPAAGSDTA